MKFLLLSLIVLLNIHSVAQTFDWKWGRGGGGSGADSGTIVTFDAKRNYAYVLGGTTSSTITIGTQTLTGTPGSYFIAKYDTAGNLKWAKRFNGYATGIDCDSVSGAVYISGTSYHFFLQKLDSLGMQQWIIGPTVTSTFPARAYGSDVIVLSNGEIALAGWFENDYVTDVLTIGSFNLTGRVGGRFVIKVSPGGNIIDANISGGQQAISTVWWEFNGQDKAKIFKLERDNEDNIFVAWNRRDGLYYPDGDACYSIVPSLGPARALLYNLYYKKIRQDVTQPANQLLFWRYRYIV